MKLFRDFKNAADKDGWMIRRLLQIRFAKATMTDKDRAAYDELSQQANSGDYKQDITITVPAHIARKNARKAIRLITLELDPSCNVTTRYEQPGKPRTPGTPGKKSP